MSHPLGDWMNDNAELFRYAGELSCMREEAERILLSGTASAFLAPLFRTLYPDSTIIVSGAEEDAVSEVLADVPDADVDPRPIESAQFSGIGKIYWTETNDISQPFYGLLNAKVGLRKGIVSFNLWGRNLTATDYQAFYFESFNRSFIQKGKPLQFGGEIAIAF